MTHQLTGRCKCRIAELTHVRFGSRVRVDVIGETSNCLEASLADVAFVRTKNDSNSTSISICTILFLPIL